MRKVMLIVAGLGLAASLSACGKSGYDRNRPDEFAVARQAPLVIPPDFELTPPVPGAPRPAEGTAAQQALDALFGGPAPRSPAETSLLDAAGRGDAPIGIRSTAWDPDTRIVDKGATTLNILAAPAANTSIASAQTGQ